MPQLISYGRELIRIGSSNKIEFSTNDGRTWNPRYTGSSAGTFHDLLPYGSKGLYFSTNQGRTWNKRN